MSNDLTLINWSPAMPSQWPQPPSDEEWLKHQHIITHLYQNQNKPLGEVQTALQRDYGFKATVQMYKRKIRKWGLDKNHKEHEVLAILRLKALRDAVGKRSTFKLRGREVNMKDIDRYLQRKKISAAELRKLITQGHSTQIKSGKQTIDLVCRTPSPVPVIGCPGSVLDEVETFYKSYNDYVLGSIESGAWTVSQGSYLVGTSTTPPRQESIFLDSMLVGMSQFEGGDYQKAMLSWRISFAHIEGLVRSHDYSLLDNVIWAIAQLALCNSQIAKMLLQHLGNLASTILAPSQPQWQILQCMTNLNPDTMRDIRLFTKRCSLPIFQLHCAGHEEFILREQLLCAFEESYQGVWAFQNDLFAKISSLLTSNAVIESTDLDLVMDFMDTLTLSDLYDEAEKLSLLMVERLQSTDNYDITPEDWLHICLRLGISQIEMKNLHKGRNNLLFALKIYQESTWEGVRRMDRKILHVLHNLVNIELEMGLVDEAEEHQSQLEVLEYEVGMEAQQRLKDLGLAEEELDNI